MGEYRLSRQAEDDLLTIYKSTEEKFGKYQADAYHAGFERSFGLLADFPRMGTSVDELVVGFRRFRFQSHYIFYTENSDDILIRGLIHVRMNLRSDLFE
jgi:toxin ParE1/3/4